MKKVLISIVVVLFMILTYFVIFKNITIASWESSNINDVKQLDSSLNEKINTAKQLNNQEYPDKVSKLDSAMEKLKVAKKKYESKMAYVSQDVNLDVVNIKSYKIERLWITLENYAKTENVELKLEVLDTSSSGLYDLSVTVIGEYIGITDFIYDIEKDDTLGFKILNFKLLPGVSTTSTTTSDPSKITNKTTADANKNSETNTTTTTTTSVRVDKLTATFKIEGVEIEFN